MYTVSCLIPVYKVERFIERCARSLFDQTYPNLEYVFVDDCSPDGSIERLQKVLEEYPWRGQTTKIIHHGMNRGLAAARNTALDNATGEFICVVDSDDWMEIGAIERLVEKQIESNADIVAGNAMMHTKDGDIPFFEKKCLSKEELVLLQMQKTWDHSIWRRIIRRSLYEDHHIRCIEGCDMTEDRLQMSILTYYAESYAQVDEIIYHYERRNECSIMAQKEKGKVLGRDYQYFRNWLAIKDFFSDKEEVFYREAKVQAMAFARRYRSATVRYASKPWYDHLASILDREDNDCQVLAGWTTKGIRGFFLHRFYLVEAKYLIAQSFKGILRYMKRGGLQFVALFFSCALLSSAISCAKDMEGISIVEADESVLDTTVIYVKPSADPLLEPPDLGGMVSITSYAELEYIHQSGAVYGDYAFFVRDGRSTICMYDMVNKTKVYTYSMKGENGKVYHCNQSSFGVEKYESTDFFPLLYISQRARSESRCFTEVFRIIPQFNSDSTAFEAFRAVRVQEIFFPPMSKENSLGNVNCVIAPKSGWMYTYSRNNDSSDDNYRKCKISRFVIPDIHQSEVVLQDPDIKSSFILDVDARNMQGGCIVDNRLYIGQGYPTAGYVYLNVVDLREERLVKRYDLLASGAVWEPEGCFYFDGSVMLSYTGGISRIEE